MKICVLGLGLAGATSAACLAREGHDVIGVDAERSKVDLVNLGCSPIPEKDLGELFAEQVPAGRLAATTETDIALRHSELALLCAEPSDTLCDEIGSALATHPGAPVIVIRGTLFPGTTRGRIIPALERASGKRAGEEFGVCVVPHFLREGSAVHDYYHPPKTLVGELNRASGDVPAALWSGLPGPLLRTDLETAEMTKYADNAWHALKIAFANELGTVCKALAIDAHELMDLFRQDHKLNLSPAYLKPGFAFGGVSLPQDLRTLLANAHALQLKLPVLSSVLPSNALQIERSVQAVVEKGNHNVGLLGLSFKAGTSELRESPLVELARQLVAGGFDVRVYDPGVSLESLPAASREFLVERIPHISRMLVGNLDDVLDHARTIVIGNASPEFRDVPRWLVDGQTVIDLVRACNSRTIVGIYEGLCW
jgi:GDP-mannose 6-dehydrogenase